MKPLEFWYLFFARTDRVIKILQNEVPHIMHILDNRDRISPYKNFTDGEPICYLGHSYRLRVTHGAGVRSFCHLRPNVMHVHISDESLLPENLQQEVRLEILLWLKKRVRIKLKRRLDLWADRFGLKYKKLIITNPQHRWGSCSADNIIRLNWRLILAPLPIMDYVVAHELCHIRHKNHAPGFWAFLASEMPDFRDRRKILRHIEHGLML